MWLWKDPNTSGPVHTHQVGQILGLGPEAMGTVPALSPADLELGNREQ